MPAKRRSTKKVRKGLRKTAGKGLRKTAGKGLRKTARKSGGAEFRYCRSINPVMNTTTVTKTDKFCFTPGTTGFTCAQELPTTDGKLPDPVNYGCKKTEETLAGNLLGTAAGYTYCAHRGDGYTKGFVYKKDGAFCTPGDSKWVCPRRLTENEMGEGGGINNWCRQSVV